MTKYPPVQFRSLEGATNRALMVTANGVIVPATLLRVEASVPEVEFHETDALVDEKNWRWVSSAGKMLLQARDDTETITNTAMEFDRTGADPTPPRFPVLAASGDRVAQISNVGQLSADNPISPIYATGTLSVASDAVTLPTLPDNCAAVLAVIDTEAGAATDNLDTINVTGTVPEGMRLVVRPLSSGRDITLVHTAAGGSGKIFNSGTQANYTMATQNFATTLTRGFNGVWISTR